MTIDLSVGHGLLPVDRTVQLSSKKSTDQVKSQTSISPASNAPQPAVMSYRSGGLLSSINIAEVLKLTDEPPVDISTLKHGLGDREWLGDAIKRSKAAYAAGDISASNSLADLFTQKDVDTIRAATGYNVVVLNGITAVVDDNGNPPSWENGHHVQKMIGDIEADRKFGRLSGEITPDYLKEMFAKYAEGNEAFPEEWLDKALSSLNSTTDKQSIIAQM